jgi:hypothetical protein
MSDSKAKWDEVGDRFSELGSRFKDRYDANASFGKVQAEQMNDALHQIVDALDAGFTALGDSLRDPGMRDDLKQAGNSIGDAISASLNDVAAQIKRATGKKS